MLICNRELLKAARTYYVRTDGSDSNNGLTDDAAGAFLTIQKAVDVALDTLDFGGFDVTIQIGDGTFTAGALVTGPQTGRGRLTIQGNTTTPSNVVISTTNAHAFVLERDAALTVRDLELRTATFGTCLRILSSIASATNVVFGSAATHHVQVAYGGRFSPGNYTIAGGAEAHVIVGFGGTVYMDTRTITLTGTPHFSTAFLYAEMCGVYRGAGLTFTGSATGTRYYVLANGAIQTNGGGANYFPGNSAGVIASGGQYT